MTNELSSLSPAPKSRKTKTRLGRGEGSGKGKTAGRGQKGQRARSKVSIWFEGGQMPLHRRLPKRGFKNIHGLEVIAVDVGLLKGRFEDNATVSLEALKDAGIVSGNPKNGIKILGNGELNQPLNFVATSFSKSALEKIKAAGGTASVDEKFVKKQYATVKIGRISAHFEPGEEITAEKLQEKKLIKDIPYNGVWVVGGGNVKALNIKAAKFSARVKAEIKRAGGTLEIDSRRFGSLKLI